MCEHDKLISRIDTDVIKDALRDAHLMTSIAALIATQGSPALRRVFGDAAVRTKAVVEECIWDYCCTALNRPADASIRVVLPLPTDEHIEVWECPEPPVLAELTPRGEA